MLAHLHRLSRFVWIDCWLEGVATFPTSFESSASKVILFERRVGRSFT